MPNFQSYQLDSQSDLDSSPKSSSSYAHDGSYLLILVFAYKPYSGSSRKATALTWNSVSFDFIGRMDYDSGNSVDRDMTINFFGKHVGPNTAAASVTFDGSGASNYYRCFFQSLTNVRDEGNVGSDDLTTFNSTGTNNTFSVTGQETKSMAIGAIMSQTTADPYSVNTGTEITKDESGAAFDLWIGYLEGSGSLEFDVDFDSADSGGKAIELLHGSAGNRAFLIASKIQDFYDELRRGLMPPQLLKRKWREAVTI
jgi:hypothetical protein